MNAKDKTSDQHFSCKYDSESALRRNADILKEALELTGINTSR